jgi:hypothetical protein
MKTSVWLFLGCVVQASGQAADLYHVVVPNGDQFAIQANSAASLLPTTREQRGPIGAGQFPGMTRRAGNIPTRESPFALAVAQAAKKGVIEASVEAYTDVLVKCQQAQSPVLTTPFMRSDNQQAHCYRF